MQFIASRLKINLPKVLKYLTTELMKQSLAAKYLTWSEE